jgi:(2Fe-2S) ferredoxin
MTELADVGFDRPKTEPLPGTVSLYHRHLLICTGRTDWPAHIDTDGGFAQALSEAIAARAAEIALKVKVTACDDPGAGPGYDILVFPDTIRYLDVQEADLPALIEDHLVGNGVSNRILHERLTGQYIFVCTHGNRDARCGVCGPPLIERFVAELAARGLAGRVTVRQTSHVGGHQYAGNVLIYPSGDWYGYVTPADVSRVVEQHIVKGEVVADLWRGRMGLSREEQARFLHLD